MIIRPEIAEDVPAIRAITSAAFRNAPHSSGTEAAIIDALRDAAALTLSLVAETQSQIIGHAAFSPVTINGRTGRWFGLGPVSVLPAEQGRGIGKALIEHGLQRLRAADALGCVVLGDPAYYRRFGFVRRKKLRYGEVPPEFFQHLSFTAVEPVGEVAYHFAFGAGKPV